MTNKQLSELLNVSKRTISNKIQKLNIEPIRVGNRFELNDNDIVRIAKNIYPDTYQEFLKKAKIAEDENAKNGKNEKENENNSSYKENNEKINENKENKTEKNAESAQDINTKLIEMLQKSLEDKENTIRAQQNQIDMLIKSNAMLTNKVAALEDKSQEPPQDIVVNEQAAAAAPTEQKQEQNNKKHWWNKIFS